MRNTTRLDQNEFIRRRLFTGTESAINRYSRLVTGDVSRWKLVKYEIITCLFGHVPGAAGIALRRVFYPRLFRKVGTGVVFGRSLTIRSPGRIILGNNVVIDDYCVLDARGAGDEGLTIGDEVIVNRFSMVLAKGGPIRIGSHSDIGAQTVVVSQGGTTIGKMVTVGGGCKIGGGGVDLDPSKDPESNSIDPNDFEARGQSRHTKGPVNIGDRTVFGRSVMILDGALVGSDCLLGSGVVIREEIPNGMAVMPRPAHVVIPRGLFGESHSDPQPKLKGQAPVGHSAEMPDPGAGTDAVRLAFRVLDEINAQLPPRKRIPKLSEAHLMEPEGPLDSLGLINLVVAAEGILKIELDRAVNLSTALEGPREGHPFTTVGTFIELIENLTGGES